MSSQWEILTTASSHLIPQPFALDDTHHFLTYTKTALFRFFENLIYNTSVALPFETYPENT